MTTTATPALLALLLAPFWAAALPTTESSELFEGFSAPSILGTPPQDGKISLKAQKFHTSRSSNPPRLLAERGTATFEVNVGSDWYIPMNIGTPGQNFLMLGDSGSPNLSIQSTLMPANETGDSPLYNPKVSSTAKQMAGYTYSECFVSGYCDSGVVYTDVVRVGTFALTGMWIQVENKNNQVSNGVRSGTLGLNFDPNGQTTSPNKLPSWFPEIKGYLAAGLWTVDYHRPSSTGTFDFGYIDAAKHTGSIGYAPVNQAGGAWAVAISGVKVGSDGAFIQTGWNIIVDTGTGDSRVPRWVADVYFARIPGSTWSDAWSTYTFPCSATLLDFTFGVGSSYRGTIPASYLMWGTIDGTNCVSHLLVGDGTVIWGMTFIEAQYIVFDWDNSRVGFANKPL